jgi:hypothetical protein
MTMMMMVMMIDPTTHLFTHARTHDRNPAHTHRMLRRLIFGGATRTVAAAAATGAAASAPRSTAPAVALLRYGRERV